MMNRQLLWAAAFALAPLSAHAGTIAFDFDTQDGLYRIYGDATISDTLNAVGGYDVTRDQRKRRRRRRGPDQRSRRQSDPAGLL